MYRCTLRRAAATSAAGFSSGAFTGDGSDPGTRLRAEQARLQAEQEANAAPAAGEGDSSTGGVPPFDAARFQHSNQVKYTGDSAYYASFGTPDGAAAAAAAVGATDSDRPTRRVYEAMSDEALLRVFQQREQQVRQLRAVYEQFHYHADKHYRKMVFDYHDKAAQLSQVHGRMQAASLQVNREALKQMREQQEMYERDKRLVLFLSGVVVFLFWVWVRRHYISKKEVLFDHEGSGKGPEAYVDPAYVRMQHSVSVTGSGSYNENYFSSSKRSGRTWETTWEREVRERREREYREKLAQQQQQQKVE
ncbi:hypothetical protein STCU_05188 [Strigomonas culicis]|uniref:Uncharacterized protein n=1 Tax=Strigomonas culicis TaxID=28005 RepID=S9UHW0_9TRYP|nr:hypothetical protein STCU_05188 [Strigomonas culicis]|eukprot:EPY28324.1 hypothetical protein STCU_05188 [Strigomonas culicis]